MRTECGRFFGGMGRTDIATLLLRSATVNKLYDSQQLLGFSEGGSDFFIIFLKRLPAILLVFTARGRDKARGHAWHNHAFVNFSAEGHDDQDPLPLDRAAKP